MRSLKVILAVAVVAIVGSLCVSAYFKWKRTPASVTGNDLAVAPSSTTSSNAVPTSSNPVPKGRSALPLQAEYHVNLPNGIMLVDSQGRRTGKDPATGIVYREIPGAHYGEDCLGRANCAGVLITNNLRDGKYTLYVLGGSTGKFGLSVYNNRGLSQSFGGDIQPNTMKAYIQNYDSAHFASSSLSFEDSVSSTASITAEPAHNL